MTREEHTSNTENQDIATPAPNYLPVLEPSNLAGNQSKQIVKGTVLSVDGENISNAEICLIEAYPDKLVHCVVSDSKGQFSLKLVTNTEGFVISAHGFLSIVEPVATKKDTFVLTPTDTSISGRVVNVDGHSVSGAILRLISITTGKLISTGSSHNDGQFTLSVDSKSNRLFLTATAVEYSQAQREITLPAQDVLLTLLPAVTLNGRVILSDSGTPLNDATVTAVLRSGASLRKFDSKTNPSGKFELNGLEPGSYQFSATGQGYYANGGVITVAQEENPSITLYADRASSVTAQVTSNSKPCPNASAHLSANEYSSQVVSDSNGLLKIPAIPPGHYMVIVACQTDFLQTSLNIPDTNTHLETHWNIEATGVIQGKVVTALGEPVSNIFIDCTSGNDSTNCVSNVEGIFSCKTQSSEYWECFAQDLETDRILSDKFPFMSDASSNKQTQQITLRPTGEVHVYVNSYETLSSLSVMLGTKDTPAREMQRVDNSKFIAKNIPFGSYEAWIPSLESARTNVEVHSAGIVNAYLTVPDLAEISGRVVDKNYNPVSGAIIRTDRVNQAGNTQQPIPPVSTDASGWFRVPNLVPGEYSLRVSRESFEVQPHRVTTGQEVEIIIGSYATIYGSVRSKSGNPVHNFQLAYKEENSDEVGIQQVQGEDGSFKLENLKPGTWMIGVTESDEGTGIVTLNVGSSQTLETRLIVDPSQSVSIADFYQKQIAESLKSINNNKSATP